jgi:hypothetical protein
MHRVSLMSVIRLLYLITEYDHTDFTFDNTTLTYWTCIEVNTAIVCACVMTLKPLISRYLPSLVRSRISRTSRHHSNAVVNPAGQLRPLTIGSRPMRKAGQDKRRRSWLVLPDRVESDALMEVVEEEEHIELMGGKKDMEAHLGNKIGMPTRPESMYLRDPRSPSAASVDGPEVRPSSAK